MADENDTSLGETQSDASARRTRGEFVRSVSGFRSLLEADPDFPAEPNRYHVFVALNCPWCHRVTLARNVLGLQSSISMDVAFPSRTNDGDEVAPNLWEFNPRRTATLTGKPLPECTAETATGHNLRLAKQIYEAEGSDEQSVPILYDKISKRIVNNESAEIIRMLNDHANALGSTRGNDTRPDLYPRADTKFSLRAEIDAINKQTYIAINNGAYKAGFSSDQVIYEQAFKGYIHALDTLEARLSEDNRPFLTGQTFTEADMRLFPTLYRHDPVYYVRMKLNGRKMLDYPFLWRWLCRVYALPGVAESGSLVHCRQGYFGRSWNKVIPVGPIHPMTYPMAYHHPELARD